MTRVNAAWHKKHKMPQNPSDEERAYWHAQHAKHCDCWPVARYLQKIFHQKLQK